MPVFVKLTPWPVHCGAVDVKDATGVELITIVCVLVCVQYWLEIVKVIVLLPDEVYITPEGFAEEEKAGIAPWPRSHE